MSVLPSSKIIELRSLLCERFPTAPVSPRASTPTGLEPVDALLGGGLPRGALTEIARQQPAMGAALLVQGLLLEAWKRGQRLALVDGHDRFDPTGQAAPALAALLWVRSDNATQAIRSADLLLRDGNLPLVVLDLTDNPVRELRGIPSATWFRFQRIAEENDLSCLILTPQPLVTSAEVRLSLSSALRLTSLDVPRSDLLAQLDLQVLRRRTSTSSAAITAFAG